jgi:hypothetical protein
LKALKMGREAWGEDKYSWSFWWPSSSRWMLVFVFQINCVPEAGIWILPTEYTCTHSPSAREQGHCQPRFLLCQLI